MGPTPVILFVLGAPGVGKTTLVRCLLGSRATRDMPPGTRNAYSLTCSEAPAPKWTWIADKSACAAGHYTGATFDGADTVPYNGARKALDWWAVHLLEKCSLTIFDGARFSTTPSLARLRELAPHHAIVGVHLVSEAAAAARRSERGTNQDPNWVKGATTGAANFAKRIDAVELHAMFSPPFLCARVLEVIERAQKSAAA